MTDLSLSCQCGALSGRLGHIERRSGERVRCYCRDCQSYAHHLGAADTALDEFGGTAMYLTTPYALEFTQGREKLACLQLSPKGPLRWYAACCNTPVANVMRNGKVPFVSLVLTAARGNVDEVLGTRETGVLASDAHGSPDRPNTHPSMDPKAALRVAARLLIGRLKGHHKSTPFFDDQGQPVSAPRVLSREQRADALAKAGFPSKNHPTP